MASAASTRSSDSSPEVVVLAGVVGSGKSTLSEAWATHLTDWVRVNQDDLGDRRTCEAAVRDALSQHKNVVVDRQNFDARQRRTWLEIAGDFPGVRVGGMVMATSKQECRERLLRRVDHPTIQDPGLAVDLLEKFTSLWEPPQLDEGFDQLITLPALPPADQIDATLIRSLLALLHASPQNPHASQQRRRRELPNVYSRPDGFVDDGTWRPPPPHDQGPPRFMPSGPTNHLPRPDYVPAWKNEPATVPRGGAYVPPSRPGPDPRYPPPPPPPWRAPPPHLSTAPYHPPSGSVGMPPSRPWMAPPRGGYRNMPGQSGPLDPAGPPPPSWAPPPNPARPP